MWSLEQQHIEHAGIIRLCHYISLLINYVDNSKHNLYVISCFVGLIPLSLSLASLLLYVSLSHTHTHSLCLVVVFSVSTDVHQDAQSHGLLK